MFKKVNGTISNNKAIVCRSLSKKYQNFLAVAPLTMEVNKGDIFAFLGPNGAGKTTTIRMLCGLISPSQGGGTVAGFDIVKDSPKIRSLIGLLPESSGYYNWMNAEEYLFHFSCLYNVEQSIARKRITNLLNSVGLANKSFAPISYYSRGMKQRLGLARTLINEPEIIFLDEPTLGLDPKGQQDIRKILLDVNHHKGVTIFLSSHNLDDVASMCNRVAIINHGMLIAQGTVNELRKLVGGVAGVVITLVNSLSLDVVRELSKMGYTSNVNPVHGNKLVDVFVSDGIQESINSILDKFSKGGLELYEVRRFEMTLDEIFFKLTESEAKVNMGENASSSINPDLETKDHLGSVN